MLCPALEDFGTHALHQASIDSPTSRCCPPSSPQPHNLFPTSHLCTYAHPLRPADPTGALYSDLGFNRGFLPESNISAYAKLLAMLAGVGSPGTIQEVGTGGRQARGRARRRRPEAGGLLAGMPPDSSAAALHTWRS